MQFAAVTLLALAASVAAVPAQEKRLLPGGPPPEIPDGLEKTSSGCFDAGDCFIYQYPDFKAQCIAGTCYKPKTQSNPLGLPTLPSFGKRAVPEPTEVRRALAEAVEKRLLPAQPPPQIPDDLEPTNSGCFDAGDCFIYQYPSFKAQCIAGKCYKPKEQSNPAGLPTLPSFGGKRSVATPVVKRLLPSSPPPEIPDGLEKTSSGCFDAGDCFIYQYPDFKAQCIAGTCYKPKTQSNPMGLPTLPSFGKRAVPTPSPVA